MLNELRAEAVGPATSGPGSTTRRWPPLALPAVLSVVAAAALVIDCWVTHACAAGDCPGFLRRVLSMAEPFGHGFGVVVAAWLIWQLDPLRRWSLPRVLTCSLGAGLAADGIKLLIARTRPDHFDFSGSVFASFTGWLPLISAGTEGQSFPSAHTATAVGLALVLAWLYPRGRWVFFVLVVMVACQRVQAGAHYPSDVLGGAALGTLIAAGCLQFGRLPGWFDRWERRMGRDFTEDGLAAPADDEATPLAA